jgi:hypothetical protein
MNEKEKIREELKEVAPHLPREAPATPFSVPEGYFENLTERITEKAKKSSQTKIILFSSRTWKQVAAAAIVTGIILSSLFIYRQSTTPDINANPEGWVKKQIKSVSDEKLNSFMDLTNQTDSLSETNASVVNHQQEIASLTKDISDEEIQSLLSEISQNETMNE